MYELDCNKLKRRFPTLWEAYTREASAESIRYLARLMELSKTERVKAGYDVAQHKGKRVRVHCVSVNGMGVARFNGMRAVEDAISLFENGWCKSR